MNKRKLASLEITNDKGFIFPVMSFIDSLVQRHTAIDASRYQQIRFVALEVLKQRIENSYPGSKGEIFVELYIVGDFFEISVRDKGIPGWQDFSFDKSGIAENKKDLRNYMISLYVDEIGMEKLGSEGQRVFVRKKILNPLNFVKPEPYEETAILDTNITIRPVVTEADVIEAIRCIYAEYGYSYSYERLYYVNSFMTLIKSKEIMSFLAVNDHGQTAGHFLLAFSDLYKNMPEVSTVVIKKEFMKDKFTFKIAVSDPDSVDKEAFVNALYTQRPLLKDAVDAEDVSKPEIIWCKMSDLEYNQRTGKLKTIIDKRS